MIQYETTNIFGLMYRPRFDNSSYNDEDSFAIYNNWLSQQGIKLFHGYQLDGCSISFSPENFAILEQLVQKYKPKTVLEIGVARDHPIYNSTRAILSNIAPDAKYVGVDLRDLHGMFVHTPNAHFLQSNSFDQSRIRKYLKDLGIDQLDLLFIDGWHSLNAFENDWLYTDLLPIGGVCAFHDSSQHPGPREYYKAINPEIFDKWIFCQNDYGIAYARRIK